MDIQIYMDIQIFYKIAMTVSYIYIAQAVCSLPYIVTWSGYTSEQTVQMNVTVNESFYWKAINNWNHLNVSNSRPFYE